MTRDRTAENALILAAARPDLSADEVTAIRESLADQGACPDWAYVVDQSFRHRLLPLLARNFLRYQLHPDMLKPTPSFLYEELFANVHHANQLRNEGMIRELGEILRELGSRGVTPVVRKGAVLSQELYGDLAARRSYDIDLMVEPEAVGVVREVLAGLGYRMGGETPNRRDIQPLPREQAVFWALKVPNLCFRRVTSERFVNSFVVDVCLNQFLPGSGYDLPAEHLALRSRDITLFGSPARAFTHEEMLIDLSVHLFKEATTLHYIALGQDLTVAKFLDIALYAERQPVDWERFVALCTQYAIERPVYFALHYTRALYPQSVPMDVMTALQPSDGTFLREIGAVDGQPHHWQGEFLARLFDTERAAHAPRTRAPI